MILKFKDVYKSANNRLHGDRNTIETIFAKQRKKTVFNYRYASLCGVAAILLLLFVTQGVKNNVENADVKKQEIVYTTQKEASAYTKKNVDVSENTFFDARLSDELKTPSTDTADMEAASNDKEYTAMPKGRMNSGNAATSYIYDDSEPDTTTEVISKDAYFSYLGLAPETEVLLSNSLAINMPSEYYITRDVHSGEIIDDSNVFIAYPKGATDKIISITVGKANPRLLEEGETKVINGINVNTAQLDGVFCAYLTYNDIWATIVSGDVSANEFESFLLDILSNKKQ